MGSLLSGVWKATSRCILKAIGEDSLRMQTVGATRHFFPLECSVGNIRGVQVDPNDSMIATHATDQADTRLCRATLVGHRLHQAEGNIDSRCQWSQVLVSGELRINPSANTTAKAWFDLGRCAREILATRSTCRFVLGFTVCGSLMRL